MLKRKHEKKSVKPENIFLIIATIMGLAFAFIQPLFIEPDSSYHFDHATYISNTVVDRASVGFPAEDYQSQPVPFTTVSGMMKDGTYYKNFFETKLPIIPKSQAPERVIGTKWYKDVMHWVPALGVKVGHMIYPSIGAMVLTARVFNLIFFIVAMYFIIKKVKAYRFVFVALSVTPTVIQFATSLSYDCYNYVIFAWLTATLLNLVIDIKEGRAVSFLSFFLRIILPVIALYPAKSNSHLLYILVLAVLIYLIGKKLKVTLKKWQVVLGSVVIVVLGATYFVLRYHEQFKLIASKFFYTFLEPYYTVLTTEVISGTNTAGVPAWFFPIQVAVLLLLLLSYTKERLPRWFAWLSLLLCAANLFGVLLTYAIDLNFAEHVITGAQGRYFTVFILLLAPSFTLLAQKITVTSKSWLKRTVVLMSVIALVLNLGITSVKFYHLQLPADEYRSGVEHYIFK